jgi:hypothetical protein
MGNPSFDTGFSDISLDVHKPAVADSRPLDRGVSRPRTRDIRRSEFRLKVHGEKTEATSSAA